MSVCSDDNTHKNYCVKKSVKKYGKLVMLKSMVVPGWGRGAEKDIQWSSQSPEISETMCSHFLAWLQFTVHRN